MNSKTFSIIVLSIVLVAVYFFAVYNVFIGLLEATAWQGFAGIILFIMGGVLVVLACFDMHKLFD